MTATLDRRYVNLNRIVGAFTVHAYSIISTDLVAFAVLEDGNFKTHSTVQTVGGVSMGSLRSRLLPADIDAIPYGPERVKAVGQYHRLLDSLATEMVKRAFPQLWASDALSFRHGDGMCSLDAFHAGVA